MEFQKMLDISLIILVAIIIIILSSQIYSIMKKEKRTKGDSGILNPLEEMKERWNNGDVKIVPELFEMVEKLQNQVSELREENIGVAVYEMRLLQEKLNPEEHSSVGRQFKHIIKTLEQ